MRENAIRLNLQTVDGCLLKLDEHCARNSRILTQLQQAAGIEYSLPVSENPTMAETGAQKLREKGTPPHRAFTPPHRSYNEDRLRPFTDYRGGPRQRPPLQHGMSVDRTEFEQRIGSGVTAPGHIRNRSFSHSDETVQPSKKGDGRVDGGSFDRHNSADVPDGAVLPRFSRSLSIGRSGSPGTLSLRPYVPAIPLTPIVTPTRMEYTSITDTIDTSCIERPVNYSPPNTPEFKPRSRRGSGQAHRKKAGHHQHKHRHRHKNAVSLNEGLRTAEETEHQQMEVSAHLFYCWLMFSVVLHLSVNKSLCGSAPASESC